MRRLLIASILSLLGCRGAHKQESIEHRLQRQGAFFQKFSGLTSLTISESTHHLGPNVIGVCTDPKDHVTTCQWAVDQLGNVFFYFTPAAKGEVFVVPAGFVK